MFGFVERPDQRCGDDLLIFNGIDYCVKRKEKKFESAQESDSQKLVIDSSFFLIQSAEALVVVWISFSGPDSLCKLL